MLRFSALVSSLFLALPLAAADNAPVATILCWHEVDAAPSHETIPRRTASDNATAEQLRYTATPEQFRAQLDYLEQHDYHVIALADLVDFLNGGRASLPPRAVVLTVDDGWLCAYSEIFPELLRRKLPWTLFVYPKIVGRGTHAVTWTQLAEMAKAGVDVESHTFTHPFLTLANNKSVTAVDYAPFLGHELAESRSAIEAKSGTSVCFLSFPYGDFDENVIAAAKTAGYEAAVTTRRAPVTATTPLFALPRYLIHNDTTMEEFKTFLP